jgi:apolipoprotein D and lipocalin family protein
MRKYFFLSGTALLFFCLFTSCASQKEFEPVSMFDSEKYVGTWYEIARFDFRFEKNLEQTTAHYQLDGKGGIKVTNRGFNYKTHEWKEATGHARFRTDKVNGALEVSFFGPFYGDYTIIRLDSNYRYALVAGKNTDYLWILSREKMIPEAVKNDYLKTAQAYGFDTKRFIWVKQSD